VSFVRVEDRDGITLAILDRPPANAISSDVIAQLSELLRKKTDASGVVIASSLPTIFSAGWDLPYVFPDGIHVSFGGSTLFEQPLPQYRCL